MTVQTLADIPTTLVDQAYAQLLSLVKAAHPELERARGPFHDLVLYYSAVFQALSQLEIQRLQNSRSLLAISEDPELQDPLLVDQVLSNYLLVRRPGASATGTITVLVDRDITIVLPADLRWSAAGQEFQASAAITARPVGTLTAAENDRILQPLGDGRYAFSFPLQSLTVGASGNLRRGSQLVPGVSPTHFVTAYAAADFIGGQAEELNTEFLARLQDGLTARAFQGRAQIGALLREQFPALRQLSIVGAGNPEQQRDKHTLFPGATGGKVDIYVQTEALPRTKSLTKTATLVERTAAGGIWQFSLDRDEAPGFYEVEVLPLTASPNDLGFAIQGDRRGWHFGDDLVQPDIATLEEAAFTRYQTAVIRFLDPETPVMATIVGETSAAYVVHVRYLPLLREMQEFTNRSDVRNLRADMLIRAPVPCFLEVFVALQQAGTEAPPDIEAIRQALAVTVNQLGFAGRLPAAQLADVVYNYLTGRQAVASIELHGRILRPTGGWHRLWSRETLVVPDDPGHGITGRTVLFFLDPRDVGVGVTASNYQESW